jgi:hypothetical protein
MRVRPRLHAVASESSGGARLSPSAARRSHRGTAARPESRARLDLLDTNLDPERLFTFELPPFGYVGGTVAEQHRALTERIGRLMESTFVLGTRVQGVRVVFNDGRGRVYQEEGGPTPFLVDVYLQDAIGEWQRVDARALAEALMSDQELRNRIRNAFIDSGTLRIQLDAWY